MTTGGYDSRLQIECVKSAIEQDYLDHIHRDGQENDKQLLSRGIAAMAVRVLTGVGILHAVDSGTDGSQDDGIDAIALDPDGSKIYVVQAKWHSAGNKVIDVGEAHKVIDGVESLLEGRLHPQNKRGAAILKQLHHPLNTPDVKVVIVIVATSDRDIDPSVDAVLRRRLSDKRAVTTRQLRLSDLYRQVIVDSEDPAPTVKARLHEWREFQEPYKALYGRISATALAAWYEAHGDGLFANNIRTSLGATEINEQIYRTLVEEPEKFWYLNNGVTILCENWPNAPGTSGDGTLFRFDSISIVNGAQTVTQAHRAWMEKPDSVDEARVAVRFIALAESPEGLGPTVTYTANSQNRVYPKDYLALDPEQVRLQKEFRLAYNSSYRLRSTDVVPFDGDGFSVEEAVSAQACSISVELSCLAKAEISQLWESTTSTPYTQLFNWRTSVPEVRRKIQVLRIVDEVLENTDPLDDEIEKAVAVHGNRLIAHAVFKSLNIAKIAHIDADWTPELEKAKNSTSLVLRALTTHVYNYLDKRYTLVNDQKRIAKLLQERRPAESLLKQTLQSVHQAEPDATPLRTLYKLPASEPKFMLNARGGVYARGYRCGDGFLVQKGSTASSENMPSLGPRYRETRQNFVDTLVFVPEEPGRFMLTRDELFDSVSDAANVMKGVPSNGKIDWRTNSGHTYRAYLDSLVPPKNAKGTDQ